jgi:Icc-related predicted phosphoesterase
MKILAIGDPHGDLKKIRKIKIKDLDLILLTGDLGKADLARKRFFEDIKREKKGLPPLEETSKDVRDSYMEVHTSTIQLLRYLSKYAPVYALQGNVGIALPSRVREIKEEHGIKVPCTRDQIDRMANVGIIKNTLRNLQGVRIGFLEFFTDTSWVKEFKPKGYKERMNFAKKQTDKAKRILRRFGKVDILLTHVPPYRVLDRVNFPGIPKDWKGKHAGSKAVLDYIKRYQPKYVFCGHIHEGEGMKKIGKTRVYNLGVAGHVIVEL